MDVKIKLSGRARFLMKASLLFKDTCPEQARFLMRRHQMKAPALPETVLCPFCFQWRQPGDYHVRVRPKRRPSAQVKKLLRKRAAHKRLNKQEMRVVQKFRKSSSFLMATCHVCNNTSRQAGMNRDFLAAFSKTYGTPVSTGKRRGSQTSNKPTPKSGIHEKTPSTTPASKSSDNSSSSKSASGKKSTFSRLRKLLMLEESQKTKKGGLKDFLSSL